MGHVVQQLREDPISGSRWSREDGEWSGHLKSLSKKTLLNVSHKSHLSVRKKLRTHFVIFARDEYPSIYMQITFKARKTYKILSVPL